MRQRGSISSPVLSASEGPGNDSLPGNSRIAAATVPPGTLLFCFRKGRPRARGTNWLLNLYVTIFLFLQSFYLRFTESLLLFQSLTLFTLSPHRHIGHIVVLNTQHVSAPFIHPRLNDLSRAVHACSHSRAGFRDGVTHSPNHPFTHSLIH